MVVVLQHCEYNEFCILKNGWNGKFYIILPQFFKKETKNKEAKEKGQKDRSLPLHSHLRVRHLKGVCNHIWELVDWSTHGEGMELVSGHLLPFCQYLWTCLLGWSVSPERKLLTFYWKVHAIVRWMEERKRLVCRGEFSHCLKYRFSLLLPVFIASNLALVMPGASEFRVLYFDFCGSELGRNLGAFNMTFNRFFCFSPTLTLIFKGF